MALSIKINCSVGSNNQIIFENSLIHVTFRKKYNLKSKSENNSKVGNLHIILGVCPSFMIVNAYIKIRPKLTTLVV